jgi:hypothetical protein
MTIAYIGECKTFACDRIRSMVFAVFVMRVLEVMFFLGLAGSAVVVLISFFEDGKELFGKD